MKSYPSISKEIVSGMDIYAFSKIDGSNIRAEFNKKQGFYKFGSRNRLLGSDQLFISEAETIVKEQWEKQLSEIFKKNQWERAIVFFEFWGDNSFAGIHQNEPHKLNLIDVNPYKKGILPPKEFVDKFGDLNIAPLLYHGPCDGEFVKSVRESFLTGMSEEGVVCKAKNPKNTNQPVMFKIKSNKWLAKLKEFCAGDDNKFLQLC